MDQYIVRVFRSPSQAEGAIRELRDLGFTGADVSVVVPNVVDDRVSDGRVAEGSDAPTVSAAATGGVLGGVAGFLLGLALTPIPGVGLVLASLPLVGSAATGAFIGAGAGLFANRLAELGVEAGAASWYEEELRAGRTLVTVRADGRAAAVRRVMRYHGGSSPPDRAEVVPDVLPADRQSA
jgi:hypothetical protein